MTTHTQTLTFRSRIDWWIAALVFGPLGLAVWRALAAARRNPTEVDWIGIGVLSLALGLVLWVFATTAYDVEAEHLVVRCGPVRERIPIATIRRITPSRTLIASPALSLRRLEIDHGTYDTAVVSPADQVGFVLALVSRNPAIDVRPPSEV